MRADGCALTCGVADGSTALAYQPFFDNNASAGYSGMSPVPVLVAVGTIGFPSKGSAGHAEGICKPCAWFHSARGCQNGPMCEFCHACDRGEIKRRKKEKAKLLYGIKSISMA